MKKLLFIIVLMVAAVTVQAKSLVITLADGTEVYYLLGGDVNPVMKFKDGKVTVNADAYEISDIKKFVISQTDDPSGIKAETFYVKGKQDIEVFSLDGKKVDTIKSTSLQSKEDAISSLSLTTLPKGVYVLKIGSATMKVLKK
ncbi:MAG: T9SS type A sorting domain-containing protein [Bacteroidales bacterium]|nr:T9SS type A sorting domain-containing protein [Bacteroidales bacterium]